jgi:hypothetical protein
MVHAMGVDPTVGAGDMLANLLAKCMPEEQAAYKQERLKRTKARAADDEREHAKHAWAANARSTTTPRTAAARVKARPTESKILRDKHGTPYFPRASQNIAAAVAKMRVMPP